LWIKGSDPATYELILKIQLLQKRLIVQAQTTIKQEAQLKECELIYSNLRQLLARQPGSEMATKLQEMQHALKAKDRKIKVCNSIVCSSSKQYQKIMLSWKIYLQILQKSVSCRLVWEPQKQ
jgi:hypothetical protein